MPRPRPKPGPKVADAGLLWSAARMQAGCRLAGCGQLPLWGASSDRGRAPAGARYRAPARPRHPAQTGHWTLVRLRTIFRAVARARDQDLINPATQSTVFTISLSETVLIVRSAISLASGGNNPTPSLAKMPKSYRLNALLSAYRNTALTNSGLCGSTASDTKLNRPGFLPSCKNPKPASNPFAITTRVILPANTPIA